MKPTFSAIIPTYNSAGSISRAIESALNQSYPPSEVLVVDDGSTDSTRDAVQPYRDRIRYLQLPHSGCVGRVRNWGIHESRGDYVAFLDADDAWYPNKLAEVVQAIEFEPGEGLFYSDFMFVDDDLRILKRANCEDISEDAYRRLLVTTPIATSTVVVSRFCFAMCGLFSEELAAAASEDWDMWIRIARKFPVAYIQEPVAEYTLHAKTPSLASTDRWISAQWFVIEKLLAEDRSLTGRERRRIRSRGHYREARFRMARRQNREAIGCLRKSIAEDPFNWRSWAISSFLLARGVMPVPKAFSRRLGLVDR